MEPNTIPIGKTLKASEEIDAKIQDMKDRFSHAMDSLLSNLKDQITVEELKETKEKPPAKEATDFQSIADIMRTSKHVVFLTGAGLSAASGIPTFRGKDGYWTHPDKDEQDPTVILTNSYFQEKPEINWEWHHDFIQLTNKCKPNFGHYAILKMQEYCAQKSLRFSLITQNIDGYHAKLIKESKILKQGSPAFGFTDGVIEVHGNVRYMRCSKGCKGFVNVPETFDKANLPKCTQCGELMRAHCLFFDECYEEEHYQSDEIVKIMKTCDFLVVIGTALETNLPNRIVRNHIENKGYTLEININPVLLKGENCWYTKEKSETCLNKLADGLCKSTVHSPIKVESKKGEIKKANVKKEINTKLTSKIKKEQKAKVSKPIAKAHPKNKI